MMVSRHVKSLDASGARYSTNLRQAEKGVSYRDKIHQIVTNNDDFNALYLAESRSIWVQYTWVGEGLPSDDLTQARAGTHDRSALFPQQEEPQTTYKR